MKRTFLISSVIAMLLLHSSATTAQNEQFSMRQLACGLSQPWEIKFGPDGFLWVTEANSYQITRIDPNTGDATLLIDLSDKKNFPDYNEADEWPQGGLQGFAFHPDFANKPYFYLSYVYQFDGCLPDTQGCYFKTKLVRYDYNMANQTLTNEVVIIDTLPGSTDHNGGRLVIGPISEDMDYLFYSIGEMGAGQLSNAARPHHGQDVDYYQGKILRFNLEPDGDANTGDAWIPNDNPFNGGGKQSAVWTLGHRNPQGLVISPSGTLYEAEHGPYSDDEINIIERGHNYGFPLIMGFVDGNYDGSRAGDGSTMPAVPSEESNRDLIEQIYPYNDPIYSLFPASQSEVMEFYNNDKNNTPPYDNYYLQYATSAPSGIDFYNSDAIPGWKSSLLVTNLKLGSVFRFKLSNNGDAIVGDTITYFEGMGRFRDIAISPDGSKIYVSADTVGMLKGAPGEAVDPPNKGCILEFSYNATGVSQYDLDNTVQLYPNPTNQGTTKLSINLSNQSEVSADLYDARGTLVDRLLPHQQVSYYEKMIDLGHLEPGSYFLKLNIGGTTVVKKLVRL